MVADDVDALDESFRQVRDGGFELADSKGSLVLGQRHTFDQLCGRYLDESQEARDAKRAMDIYVEAVLKRNQTILRYNETVAQIRTATAEREAARHTIDQLRDAQALRDPTDLGAAAAHLGLVLARRKEECLRLLYEASRAYSLITLEPDSTFHDTVGLDDIDDITPAAARDAASTLVENRRKHVDPLFPQLRLPVETGDEEFARAGGVRFALSKAGNAELFRGLAEGVGVVRLDMDRYTRGQGAPFARMRNVRLRAVRCWLHDLRAAPPGQRPEVYRVRLQHLGDSTFETKDGLVDQRSHDPVTVDFRYHRGHAGEHDSYRGIYDPALVGVQDGLMPGGKHVLFSPFATWKIELPDVAEGRADGSHLEEIRFETVRIL